MSTEKTDTLEVLPPQTADEHIKQVVTWEPFEAKLAKLKLTAETLQVTDVSQVAEMKLARATRLTLRELRIAIEHRRKELGEYHLHETQRINAGAKTLKDLIEPLETRLLDQEQFIERAEQQRKDALKAARTIELSAFVADPSLYNLAEMPEGAYAELLAGSKAAVEARRLEAERIEAERLAKEKRDAEERERMRQENERLKQEAAAQEAAARKEREAAEAERQKLLKQAEAERAKAAEQARIAAEKARKEQEAIEAKARAEREAAEAVARKEREARQKLEAEQTAQKAAQARAAEEAKRAAEKAAAAPDKEKLFAFAESIRKLNRPILNTKQGVAAMAAIRQQVEELTTWIDEAARAL